jgi:hypothetical protein
MKRIIRLIILVLPFCNMTSFAQTVILAEDFTNYGGTANTIPAGWYFSYNGIYSSAGNYGPSGPNAYKFGTDNASIVSPAFSNANRLTFWLKGNTTDSASTITVFESADSVNWDTLAILNNLPHTGNVFSMQINTTSTYLRFAFHKSVGNVAFDDFLLTNTGTTAVLPKPAHIVIAVLGKHTYQQIIGSGDAPYIDSLASIGALFTNSHGISTYSQPNYLDLFSGCDQGVTTDAFPSSQFTSENLGASLITIGESFAGYSETLPSEGFTGNTSGDYTRRHAPWVNWQGTGPNQLDSASNKAFAGFPSDYNNLPTVSFVIPNQSNGMYLGTDPGKITKADNWIRNNLGAYINWAASNNSLFILTFDMDSAANQSPIPTIFTGAMVLPGQYSQMINHFNVLRTLEEMYGLPYACLSVNYTAISNCWSSVSTKETIKPDAGFHLYPNPTSDKLSIEYNTPAGRNSIRILIYNTLGEIMLEKSENMNQQGQNKLDINTSSLSNGIYFLKLFINDKSINSSEKIIISR